MEQRLSVKSITPNLEKTWKIIRKKDRVRTLSPQRILVVGTVLCSNRLTSGHDFYFCCAMLFGVTEA